VFLQQHHRTRAGGVQYPDEQEICQDDHKTSCCKHPSSFLSVTCKCQSSLYVLNVVVSTLWFGSEAFQYRADYYNDMWPRVFNCANYNSA